MAVASVCDVGDRCWPRGCGGLAGALEKILKDNTKLNYTYESKQVIRK